MKQSHNEVINEASLDYHSDDTAERRKKTATTRRTSSFDRKYSKKEKVLLLNRSEDEAKTKKEVSKLNKKIDEVVRRHSKNYGKKSIDSAPSSSAENEKEKRRTRKVSLSKRKKNSFRTDPKSKLQENNTDNDITQQDAVRRPSKFRRRRKSSDTTRSQMYSRIIRSRVESIGTDNLIFKLDRVKEPAKGCTNLIRMYSGTASDKSEFKTCNGFSSDQFADIDDYSSANSDADVRSRQPQRGLAQRVWRSINSLFQNDDKLRKDKSVIDIRPLRRRSLQKIKWLSRSMPGGLPEKSKSEITKQNKRTSKDDMFLLDLRYDHNDEILDAMNIRRTKEKEIINNEEYETNNALSKSLDLLSTSNSTVVAGRRGSLPGRICVDCYETNYNAKFNVIMSQSPGHSTSTPSRCSNNVSTSTSFDKSTIQLIENIHQGSEYTPQNNQYSQNCLNNLKSTLQLELKSYLCDKTFSPENISKWCRILSESIKDRVVRLTEDSFKVVAQVFIGALHDDGIHAAVQSTSDKNKDGFVAVTFRGKDLFAIASILAFNME